MPKSDTWPGGVAVESVSGMDSAGSCDSVLSINSGFSDDSLEHLSAEERACLMFLEETIESLEVEDDSGLSNDEPDCLSNGLNGKTAHQTSIGQNKSEDLLAHEDPNQVIGRDHKPSHKYLVPTPLLIASGNAKIVKPMETSPKEAPVAFIDVPDGFRSSPDLQEPRRTVSEGASSKVSPAKPSTGLSNDVVDLPPSFIPEPPVRTSVTKAEDGVPKSLDVKSQPKEQKVSSEVSLEFIPPPSDFMDNPADNTSLAPSVCDEPPEWIPELPKTEPQASVGSVKPTEVTRSQIVEPETSRGPLSHNEIENLRKRASIKKAPHLTPITIVQHSAADKPMTPSPSSEHSPAMPKEYSDLKSPPVVAPKPKKLPSNIILKSHKDTGATHSLLPQGERPQMDPQKIRMEALKKLGLLKKEEVETGSGVSPSRSPTFKAKPHPQSPSYPTAPVESTQELSRFSESPVPGDMQLPTETLKHQVTRSREGSLKNQPTRSYEIKSASLERAGSRKVIEPVTNTDRTHVELSPGQLRKSRARPPSVGSAKDFGIGHQADDSAKSPQAPVVHAGSEHQKLHRPNGISVMISPNSKNGENRREALKKLGLLKD